MKFKGGGRYNVLDIWKDRVVMGTIGKPTADQIVEIVDDNNERFKDNEDMQISGGDEDIRIVPYPDTWLFKNFEVQRVGEFVDESLEPYISVIDRLPFTDKVREEIEEVEGLRSVWYTVYGRKQDGTACAIMDSDSDSWAVEVCDFLNGVLEAAGIRDPERLGYYRHPRIWEYVKGRAIKPKKRKGSK